MPDPVDTHLKPDTPQTITELVETLGISQRFMDILRELKAQEAQAFDDLKRYLLSWDGGDDAGLSAH